MHGVPLDLDQLNVAICAVVKLATTPPGVLHQVTLRPDKVNGELIRLGETRGDEASCWIHRDMVRVIEILGRATPKDEANPDACEWVVNGIEPEQRRTA